MDVQRQQINAMEATLSCEKFILPSFFQLIRKVLCFVTIEDGTANKWNENGAFLIENSISKMDFFIFLLLYNCNSTCF